MAGEVRELALKTAAESRHARALVEQAELDVLAGQRNIGESSAHVEEVSKLITGALERASAIASSSSKQSNSLSQARDAIDRLDGTTLQNARLG